MRKRKGVTYDWNPHDCPESQPFYGWQEKGHYIGSHVKGAKSV